MIFVTVTASLTSLKTMVSVTIRPVAARSTMIPTAASAITVRMICNVIGIPTPKSVIKNRNNVVTFWLSYFGLAKTVFKTYLTISGKISF